MASLAEFKRAWHASEDTPPDNVISELLLTHHPLDVMCNWFDIRRRNQHLQIASRLCDLRIEGVARAGRSDSLQPYLQVYFIQHGLITADDDDWLVMFRRAAEKVGMSQHLNHVPDTQIHADAIELMALMADMDPEVSVKCVQQFGAVADLPMHSPEI